MNEIEIPSNPEGNTTFFHGNSARIFGIPLQEFIDQHLKPFSVYEGHNFLEIKIELSEVSKLVIYIFKTLDTTDQLLQIQGRTYPVSSGLQTWE